MMAMGSWAKREESKLATHWAITIFGIGMRQVSSTRGAADFGRAPDFIVLHEVAFDAFFGREGLEPFDGFPPGGQGDIGVGEIGGGDRAVRGSLIRVSEPV